MVQFDHFISFLHQQHETAVYNEQIKSALSEATVLLGKASDFDKILEKYTDYDQKLQDSVNISLINKVDIKNINDVSQDFLSAIEHKEKNVFPKLLAIYNLLNDALLPPEFRTVQLKLADNLSSESKEILNYKEVIALVRKVEGFSNKIERMNEIVFPRLQSLYDILQNPLYPFRLIGRKLADELSNDCNNVIDHREVDAVDGKIIKLFNTINEDINAREVLQPQLIHLQNMVDISPFTLNASLKESLGSIKSKYNMPIAFTGVEPIKIEIENLLKAIEDFIKKSEFERNEAGAKVVKNIFIIIGIVIGLFMVVPFIIANAENIATGIVVLIIIGIVISRSI